MNNKSVLMIALIVVFAGVLGYQLFLRDSHIDNENVDSSSSIYKNDAILEKDILNKDNRFDIKIDYYTVKEGDTLESIAGDYALNVNTILWANDMSKESVEIGQVLKIPPMDGVLVVVKEGDNIENLAEKYNSTTQDTADFNWLDAPFELEIGSEIFIPNGTL
jgi:hypothetical protein